VLAGTPPAIGPFGPSRRSEGRSCPGPSRPGDGAPSLRAELADVIRELLLWAAGEAADTGGSRTCSAWPAPRTSCTGSTTTDPSPRRPSASVSASAPAEHGCSSPSCGPTPMALSTSKGHGLLRRCRRQPHDGPGLRSGRFPGAPSGRAPEATEL